MGVGRVWLLPCKKLENGRIKHNPKILIELITIDEVINRDTVIEIQFDAQRVAI
jgi:hypothetical protein